MAVIHTPPTYKVLVLMHSEVLIGFHMGNSATHVIAHIRHSFTKSETKANTSQSGMLKEGCSYKLLMSYLHPPFCTLILLKHLAKTKTHIYMTFLYDIKD